MNLLNKELKNGNDISLLKLATTLYLISEVIKTDKDISQDLYYSIKNIDAKVLATYVDVLKKIRQTEFPS
jgi:hypothetical protein